MEKGISFADANFIGLGYRVDKNYYNAIIYKHKIYPVEIRFLTDSKQVKYENETDLFDVELHLVIHEKMKELGWLDE